MRKLMALLAVSCMLTFTGCVTKIEPYFYEVANHQNGIPAWLLLGLHAYRGGSATDVDAVSWYNDATERGLPGLTDEWFIPGFIEHELQEDAHDVALAFVRHLSESGELSNLISLYFRDITPWYEAEGWCENQAREAERTRAALWADFVASDVNISPVIFQYTFGDSKMLTGRGVISVEFNALAQDGWYFFTSSGWTRDIVNRYIAFSEESIRFVGDWLGYQHDRPLISVHKAPPYDFGIAQFGGGGRFWGDTGRTRTIDTMFAVGNPHALTVHAHEATHALLYLSPITRSNVPSPPEEFMLDELNTGDFEFGQLAFEEGLCVLLQYLFLLYTDDSHFAARVSDMSVFPLLASLTGDGMTIEDEIEEALRTIDAYSEIGGFDTYEDFAAFAGEFFAHWYTTGEGAALGRTATTDELAKYLHLTAYQVISGQTWRMFSWLYDMDAALAAGVPYAVLFDHYTAASFFLYLLEHRGTKHDFLRFFQDIHLAQEVYGERLDSLVDEWRSYLDARFEEYAAGNIAEDDFPAEILEWHDAFFERYMEWFMEWMMIQLEGN